MSDDAANARDRDLRGSFLAVLGLQELPGTVPDLAFVCDSRGALLWGSSAFEALAGHPLSEWVGGDLLSYLPPAARRRALRALARQRRRDEPGFEVVLPVSNPRGGETDVTVRVRTWKRADGQVCLAGTVHEAGADVAAEPAVRGADVAGTGGTGGETEPLAAGEVLATVNREIRAPMNALIGMARLLLQTELSEEQKALADLIWKSGQAVLRLLNDACVFTRPESGRLDLDLIPFDLRVAVDETAAALAPLAADRGVELQCRVHPAVPSRLRGDPGRLRQILMNLGERVMQGPACWRVELLVSRLRETEQGVTLRFLVLGRNAAADGPGAAPAAPARPRCGSGNVWGPAVIQRLADLMGGKTGSDSTGGEGCRHWFDVGLAKQEEAEPTPIQCPSRTELATRRALIVDSSPVAVRALRARLAGVGCRVAEARDAEEALSSLRAAVEAGDPFHFVLIDRDLPGLDGEELGAMIRADHALDVARTVVLTTVGRRGDAARARARGFSAFLPKTMGVEELADALCEVIRQAMVTPPGGTPELVTRYSLVEGRRSQTRVLLVDEDTVNQVVTQWYVRRLGYRLEIAGTIADARISWADGGFDIVMVDEQLPDGDALALARELWDGGADGRPASFVAMFREEDSPARAAWLESGLGGAITKPVDLAVLAQVLERLTGTGIAAGPTVEDEGDGMLAVRPASPRDRLDIVTPDVDRILTEAEAQVMLASAMRFATSATTPAVPAPVTADETLAGSAAVEAVPGAPTAGEAAAEAPADWPPVAVVPVAVEIPPEAVAHDEPPAAAEPAAWPAAGDAPGGPCASPMPLPAVLTPEDVQILQAPSGPATGQEPTAWPCGSCATETGWQDVAVPAVEPAVDAAADAEPEALVEPVDWTELEVEPEIPDGAEPEAPAEAVEWTEFGVEPEAPAEVELEVLADAAAWTEPEVEAEVPAEVEPEVLADAAAWTEPELEAEVPADAEPEVLAEAEPEAEPEVAAEAEPPLEPVEQVEAADEPPRAPVHLELVESPAPRAAAECEPAAGFDLGRLETASMGLPSLRQALLGTFVNEVNPFLEKLSWVLTDEDAQALAADTHALAVLSRSIGAIALAEVLEELERRGAEEGLKATDPILQRCHAQGLDAAAGVRALLGPHRRAA